MYVFYLFIHNLGKKQQSGGRGVGRPRKGKSRSPRKPPGPSPQKPTAPPEAKLEFKILQEGEDGYFISEDEEDPDLNAVGTRTRSQSRSSFSTTPRDAWNSPTNSSPLSRVNENFELKSESPQFFRTWPDKEYNSTEDLLPASKRWDSIKWQSRKIIEKTIKTLSLDMNYTGTRRYTPRDVSSFIEAIRHNPSSQVLLPQLVIYKL